MPIHDKSSYLSVMLFPMLIMTLAVGGCETASPVRIAVLLPLSGASDPGWGEAIDLAFENIEIAGGIAGLAPQPVWFDLNQVDLDDAIDSVIADNSIVAVIGPDQSDTILGRSGAGRRLTAARKPMISPAATSVELFRVFSSSIRETGQPQYVWRTVASDFAQMNQMLELAEVDTERSYAMLFPEGSYGETFRRGLAFQEVDLQLNVLDYIEYSQKNDDCARAARMGAGLGADVLFAVAKTPEDGVCIARALKANGSTARVIYSDGAYSPDLVSGWPTESDGMEGTAPISPPASFFDDAWMARTGSLPPPYAANAYDAVLMLALALQLSNAQGGDSLARSLARIAAGRGEATGWDAAGIQRAIELIQAGQPLPDLNGASGNLDFDPDYGIEPVEAHYGHWTVSAGTLSITASLHDAAENGAASSNKQADSKIGVDAYGDHGDTPTVPKRNLWALLVSLSTGWPNYRHQSDVLAHYQMLRQNGVPDERIILILEGDVAKQGDSPFNGAVMNQVPGEDLFRDVVIDYKTSWIDAGDFLEIMKGRKSSNLPHVLESGNQDNVYVFISGHGFQDEGLALEGASGVEIIDPRQFGETISQMSANGAYRLMFVAVDTCYSGQLGSHVVAPGVLLMTSAGTDEPSYATNHLLEYDMWLSDEMSFRLWQIGVSQSDPNMSDLFLTLYAGVYWSHVHIFNPIGYGPMASTTLSEFITP